MGTQTLERWFLSSRHKWSARVRDTKRKPDHRLQAPGPLEATPEIIVPQSFPGLITTGDANNDLTFGLALCGVGALLVPRLFGAETLGELPFLFRVHVGFAESADESRSESKPLMGLQLLLRVLVWLCRFCRSGSHRRWAKG